METFSALLALCAGNSPMTGEFPSQRPVTRILDVFFDLRLNKRRLNNRDAGDFRRRRTHYDVTVGCDFISYQLNLGAVQRPWSSSSRSVWWASYRSLHGAWKPTQHIWSRETTFRICRVNHSRILCEETWRSIYNNFSASKWHEEFKSLLL